MWKAKKLEIIPTPLSHIQKKSEKSNKYLLNKLVKRKTQRWNTRKFFWHFKIINFFSCYVQISQDKNINQYYAFIVCACIVNKNTYS